MKKIDSQWFKDRMAQREISLRQLAKLMGLDPGALSRMINGTRKMQMDEANLLAAHLAVNVNEVMERAGIPVATRPQAKVMISATIDERGRISMLDNPINVPQGILERASATVASIGVARVVAAQIRALSGPLSLIDDALVLFRSSDLVDPVSIGMLSVCQSSDGLVIAKLEKTRKTGEATIMGVDGEPIDIQILSATPVLAIIP